MEERISRNYLEAIRKLPSRVTQQSSMIDSFPRDDMGPNDEEYINNEGDSEDSLDEEIFKSYHTRKKQKIIDNTIYLEEESDNKGKLNLN